jgi:hypothetical protein
MSKVYVAILRANKGNKSKPLAVSQSLDLIKKEVDEFYDVTRGYKIPDNPMGERISFTPADPKKSTDYEGYLTYNCHYLNLKKEGLDYVDLYCVEFTK